MASAQQPAAPLAGVTVVALEQAVSAPMCTRALADFGARVIKVENPPAADFARHYDDVVNGPGGLAAHFVWANRNKESVALDLKAPEASTSCTGCSTAPTCWCRTWHRDRRPGSASRPTSCGTATSR
jgi:crotonobetainyl-CoA:carnitine CoA-transferase CaiB-like acyl-CoA transferase